LTLRKRKNHWEAAVSVVYSMNPKGDVNRELFFLYENLSRYVSTPPKSWNPDNIRDFTIIFNYTGRLMEYWNAAIRETAEGQGVSHGRRNKILYYIAKIIMLKDSIERSVGDVQGLYLLQEMDQVLDEVGRIITLICVLEDTA